MIGGEQRHAAGYVINELCEQIGPLPRENDIKAVFTRGATSEGKRVMSKYDFRKLPEPSEISYLTVTETALDRDAIRRRLAYR